MLRTVPKLEVTYLSVLQLLSSLIIYMLRRMETTAFLAFFNVQLRHLSRWTEENHDKSVIYNSLSVGRHLNSVLLGTKQKCYPVTGLFSNK